MPEGRLRVLVEQHAGGHQVTGDGLGGRLVEGAQFAAHLRSQLFGFDTVGKRRIVIARGGLLTGGPRWPRAAVTVPPWPGSLIPDRSGGPGRPALIAGFTSLLWTAAAASGSAPRLPPFATCSVVDH
ncbi:hypothetical protein ACT18_20340 [Mycolicibacter kumamotonensis]|uniref:Uncharacterized protein n=1 Tax=Mycolicibacter kumamotonensis TaxID=354243 RepID=A0A1B8SB57_9MYCO|nr:hypothetical protein ACT18_20340 [Mycolicibacter kumamotonensis]